MGYSSLIRSELLLISDVVKGERGWVGRCVATSTAGVDKTCSVDIRFLNSLNTSEADVSAKDKETARDWKETTRPTLKAIVMPISSIH